MDGLNALLQATSVQDVSRCVDAAFAVRRLSAAQLSAEATAGAPGPAEVAIDSIQHILGLESRGDAAREALVPGSPGASEEVVHYLFSESNPDAQGVHAKLRSMLSQIFISRVRGPWLEAAYLSRVSACSKLRATDWTVAVRRASSEVSRLNAPCLLLQLDVERPSSSSAMPPLPDSERVCVELSPEGLGALLDGLGRIRDQLALMG